MIEARARAVAVTVKKLNSEKENWDVLVESMRYPNIFLTWHWIRTWYEETQSKFQPLPIQFIGEEGIIGYLPLFIDTKAGVRTLRLAGNDIHTDHLEIIAKPENIEICLRSLDEFLERTRRRWDRIKIDGLLQDSALLQLGHGKWQSEKTIYSKAPYIKVSRDFDEYLADFPKKRRYNLKYPYNRLLKEKNAEYVIYTQEQFAGALKCLFELHSKRSASKRIRSSFTSERVGCFHAKLLERIPANNVFLRGMSVDGRPIAIMYGFVYAGRLFNYQITHDPSWDKSAPGSALLYRVLQEVHELQLEEFNFLQGDEPYKYHWTKTERGVSQLIVINSSLRGRIYSRIRKSHVSVARVVKRLAFMQRSR